MRRKKDNRRELSLAGHYHENGPLVIGGFPPNPEVLWTTSMMRILFGNTPRVRFALTTRKMDSNMVLRDGNHGDFRDPRKPGLRRQRKPNKKK